MTQEPFPHNQSGARRMSGANMAKATITTSWDDGHELDLRLADMLSRHGLRGTFYIPRQGEQPVMSDAQIRQLSQTHEIGGHTLTHPELTRLSDDDARREIVGCRDWLTDVLGGPIRMFCPPRGKFRPQHRTIMLDAGFIGFRTVECWSIDGPRRFSGIMELPTTCQAYPHGLRPYLTNLLKRRNGSGIGLLARAYRRDWVAQTLRAAQLTLHTGGSFHLWGHSWEIEALDLWPSLDRLLAALGELARHAHVMTNGQVCRTATWRRLRRRQAASINAPVPSKSNEAAASHDA